VDIEPSWSATGDRIVFVSSRDYGIVIHTMNADGSNVMALPSDGEFWDMAPHVSPTNNRIAFVVRSEMNLPILYTANPDGTNRQIFDGGGTGSQHRNKPRWSPDGTKILFHIWEYFSNDAEICVKNIDGSGFAQLTNTGGSNFHPSWQPVVPARTFADFDGDSKADVSVFRPSDSTWYLQRSQVGFFTAHFGLGTDKITPADYDNDGRTDIAVYRNGIWYLLCSQLGFTSVIFGQANDIPQPADFDGNGSAELAVYRGGTWYTYNLATNQVNAVPFGTSTDRPVVGDYDGDGRADQAVYRDGIWYLNRSTQGFAAIQFGLATDRVVPADYDGDGKTDVAVYRDGAWYVLGSQTGFTAVQFGIASDIPVPADYDGDGRTDIAVYRDGVWYLLQSANGFAAVQFGLAEDKPVPAAFLP
jgi:(2Fe-2S) ferredoxin